MHPRPGPRRRVARLVGRLGQRIRGRDRGETLWIAKARADREVVKVRYPGLFEDACALFFAIDPAGINFDTNVDEYEAEVGTVVPRLEDASSVEDVRRILDEEFEQWFGHGYKPQRLDQLASALWPLWVKWTATRPPGRSDPR